jgi:hypothetical protein
MYEMILEPMLARFIELYENPLCENPTAATDSQLADFYECFSGVADAGNTEAALVLFREILSSPKNFLKFI